MDKRIIELMMIFSVIAVIFITACSTVKPTTQIPNPASKNCVDNGGALEIRTAADGSQSGYCTLKDGVVCEEWAYMRGECPAKAYVSTDLENCKVIRFMCVQGKQPFQDDKGCGCEPMPEANTTINTNTTDNVTEQCNVICAAGFSPAKNGTECICVPDASPGKLKAYDCTDPRPTACTKEYMPVCGQVQVQCIRAPCPPVMETFGNKCEACANSMTISYMQGACKDDNLAGGTVPAGNSSEQCISNGGSYDEQYKECAGISQGQCTELGGTFNECASACRHDPNATVCTMQCVIFCQLK